MLISVLIHTGIKRVAIALWLINLFGLLEELRWWSMIVDEFMEYIIQCAECRAVQVARASQDWSSVQDYQQDIVLYVIRHANAFNQNKGKPKTFIDLLARRAAINIIRHINAIHRKEAGYARFVKRYHKLYK